MVDDDEVQRPTSEILFRQSSVETRLSPVHLSEEDDEVEEDNLEKFTAPKIVGMKKKPNVTIENVPSKPFVAPKPKNMSPKILENDMKDEMIEALANKTREQINNEPADVSEADKSTKDAFKNRLGKILDKPKSADNNVDLTNKSASDKNRKKDANKTNDQFKDELGKKLGVGLRKNSAPPPPPPRRSSTLISSENSMTEKINDDVKPPPARHSGTLISTENAMTEKTNDNVKKIMPTRNSDTEKITDEEKNLQITEEIKNKLGEKEDAMEYSVGALKALVMKERERDFDEDSYNNTVGGAIQKKEDMATLRPKSPRPVPLKGEKEETIWDKIGTLGRKKRIKEVQEVQAEGKYAIDSPGCPTAPVIPPEDYNLEDNEERCMIDPRSYDDPKFMDLLYVLQEWISDELASQRIIVQDLSEDLYDGQVLQKLLEKLTGDKLDVPEVTQSEEGQKQKLTVVLDHFNKVLGIQRQTHNKWNVESIHSKNIVAITHLLVALARHFRPPVRLPEHVSVEVVVVQKANGKLFHKTVRESLTKTYDDVGMRCERDAFDTLFDHAPDKLQIVKKSLVTFVNKHLNKMNFEVTEIESQFHDGVYLIMLMGLLEGFFVPHYSFHLTPHEFEQKVHNVNFAFELMEETGLQKPKARPEDVVNMDLKSTLRVLYNLFLRYRTII